MIFTSFSDPGIINRKKNEIYEMKKKKKLRETSGKLNIKPSLEFSVNQTGFKINYKFCETCFIIKPLKSHHCYDSSLWRTSKRISRSIMSTYYY